MSYPSSEHYPSGQEPSYGTPDEPATSTNSVPGSPPPPPPIGDMSMSGYGTTAPNYGVPMGQGANVYGGGEMPGGMYSYPMIPYVPDAPYSDAALWLGIIGLASIIIFFPIAVVVCPLAMIFGFVGRSKVKKAPPNSYQTGKLTAGWILGMIGTAIMVLAIAGIVLFLIALSNADIQG